MVISNEIKLFVISVPLDQEDNEKISNFLSKENSEIEAAGGVAHREKQV